MAFRAKMKVRFGDIDHAGIVYYPRFAKFFHESLEDFFDDELQLPYAKFLDIDRLGFPTVHLDLQFFSPVRFGDRLEVEVRIEKIGRTSVRWRHDIFVVGRDGPVVTGFITTVLVDMDSLQKREIPSWLRETFIRYQERCLENFASRDALSS